MWFSKFLFGLYAKVTGRNSVNAPKELIQEQLNEKRTLPVGRQEAEEWMNRIISGAMLNADPESQKFALLNTLMHLGPTVDAECDAYFIKTLRKYAVNQVADTLRNEIRDNAKARLAEQEKQNQAAVTPPGATDAKVLEIKRV